MMRRSMLTVLAVLGLVACTAQNDSSDVVSPAATQPAIAQITVHKTPTCGCCATWVEHVRSKGFTVAVHDHADLTKIRQTLDIPHQLASCHSAEVDGYALEGHVPASDIVRLLSERPDAIGLAVPGMPASAPGMDVEGVSQPFTTLLFGEETASVFAHHEAEAPT